VLSVSVAIGSTAVKADAWHHLSDAVTSTAAFIGISIALWGGPGWESADDWATLIAVVVIAYNGFAILIVALRDLMDAAPEAKVIDEIRRVAEGVPDVLAVEKLLVRRSGMVYHVAIHVQSASTMSLHEAHIVGGRVKGAIKAGNPKVAAVLVHMEPYEDELPTNP
jgi:cation diffusion facilitator family transporter